MSLLRELQHLSHEWRKANFPPETITPMHQALGVAEEVGELCHAILKMEQGIRGTREHHLETAADSVGDIVVFLAGVCSTLDIDLDLAVQKAWDQVSRRNWKDNPDTGLMEDARASGGAAE